MAAIQNLCTNCVLIENGTIFFKGDTKVAIDKYLHSKNREPEVCLGERKDRKGLGHIKAVETWLENSSGKRTTSIQMGDDLTIAVKLKQMQTTFLKGNLTVSFALNTQSEFPISDIKSSFSNKVLKLSENEEQVIVKVFIPKIPLNESKYFYNVYIELDGVLQDWVIKANTINIEKGDFYKTGRIPETQRLILFDQCWSLK